MHTLERSKKVTHLSPHTFTSVGMHFSDAIAVIVTCPFSCRMAHNVVLPFHSTVPAPFVGAQLGRRAGELVHMTEQGCRIGGVSHSQSYLPTFSTYRANDGRPVGLISAMSSPFVSSPPGWVPPVEMLLTFFPPHSETSRPFQYARRQVLCWVGDLGHFVAVVCVSGVRCFWQLLTRRLWWRCSLLSAHPLSATPPAVGSGVDAQTPCPCTVCTRSDTFDTCTLASGSGASCETVELVQQVLCILGSDNAAPARGSAPLSIRCSLVRLVNRLLEIPYLHFNFYSHSFQS